VLGRTSYNVATREPLGSAAYLESLSRVPCGLNAQGTVVQIKVARA